MKKHVAMALIVAIGASVMLMISVFRRGVPDVESGVGSVVPVDDGSLRARLESLRAESAGKTPEEVRRVMDRAEEELRQSGLVASSLGEGARAPLFELPDHTGTKVRMYEYLQTGPVVLMFYRGGWCPYCNLQLRAMQEVLPELKAMGATLIAVTPDSAEGTAESVGKHELAFPVLTDKENRVARAFGLVFELPPELVAVYEAFGIDLSERNKSEKRELPLAATYVIGRDGVIHYAFRDEAYYRRAEPAEVLEVVRKLVMPEASTDSVPDA